MEVEVGIGLPAVEVEEDNLEVLVWDQVVNVFAQTVGQELPIKLVTPATEYLVQSAGLQ